MVRMNSIYPSTPVCSSSSSGSRGSAESISVVLCYMQHRNHGTVHLSCLAVLKIFALGLWIISAITSIIPPYTNACLHSVSIYISFTLALNRLLHSLQHLHVTHKFEVWAPKEKLQDSFVKGHLWKGLSAYRVCRDDRKISSLFRG